MSVRVLVGHVLDRLADLPDECVHCVVTSPPYYGLRSYGTAPQVWGGDPNCEHEWGAEGKSEQRLRNGESNSTVNNGRITERPTGETLHPSTGAFCHCGAWRGDLGLEPTPELFIAHLVEVFREARRVLRKDGTLWLNIGDSYAGSWGAQGRRITESDDASWHGSQIKNHPKLASHTGSIRSAGLKPKDLMMLPAQLALALRADGWVLRSEIVWGKAAPMPESCTDRPTCAHEKIFLLAKSNKPTFWTHRDHEGSRTKPAPDYRWQQTDDHGRVVSEQDFEPPGFRKDWPHWKRINLWAAHDYFYDAEAVKEEAESKWEDSHYKYYRDKGTSVRNTNADRNDTEAGERFGETSKNRYVGTRNMRNVWHLGPEPFTEWGETVRQVRVEADAPVDGKKRKASPDCPLHGDHPGPASNGRGDGHADAASSRSARNDSRPAPGQPSDFVPIALHRARVIEQQSSDLPLLSCSPSATPHSIESRRTDLAPETNPPCSASVQTDGRIADKSASPESCDLVEHTPESNKAPDAQKAVYRNADNPSEHLECTCEWYIEKTEKTSHFATFVTEIPRRAILAGTSAKGVCPKCGAPWVRVVEKAAPPSQQTDRQQHITDAQVSRTGGTKSGGKNSTTFGLAADEMPQSVTIGWRRSCSCGSEGKYTDPMPATCLDPFLGAGTTALVADQLGRDCIGIELAPSYAAMSERRVRDDAGMFAEIAAE